MKGYKVIVIEDAHTMTPEAMAALLKPLEEPTSKTVIILTTSMPGLLSKTIKSRCIRINF